MQAGKGPFPVFPANIVAMFTTTRLQHTLASLWLLIAFIYPLSLLAETIPSTPSDPMVTEPLIFYRANSTWSSTWYESTNIVEACNAAIADRNAHTNYCGAASLAYISPDPATNSAGYCYVTRASCQDTLPGAVWEKLFICQSPSTLNADNKCVTQNYTCTSGEGWTLSSDQQTCSRPDCPAGYERDPVTGVCQEPCPSGYVRNLSTQQCEIVCSAPLVRTTANTCDCPDPLTLIEGNVCIGRDDKDRGGYCESPSKTGL